MSHEESLLKFDELNELSSPDTPYILDENVQGFLEINDFLSKILDASELISIILEFLDSEEK